jgi:hypothetical protein
LSAGKRFLQLVAPSVLLTSDIIVAKVRAEQKVTRRGGVFGHRISAFTLAESLVSVLALAIVLVSLYAAFSEGFGLIKSAREELRATQIMVQKMEAIRLYTWSQINTNNFLPRTFTDWYWPSGVSNGTAGLTYSGFVDISVAPPGLPADYQAKMCQVTITLYWTNSPSGEYKNPVVRMRQMQTYVARYGMQDYNYIAP